jgi:2,4-dienoyl-CoA reductase-like NADH-dependent reductase (Old Yellow Enzyme family)
MAELFSPGKIGSLNLSNRMIRTASHEGLADPRGAPTEAQFQFYRGFVEGGLGLVITGYAGVMQNGKSSLYHMTMMDADELVPAHQAMVAKIHALGGKIVSQIAHCGRQTRSAATGEPLLVAPSSIPSPVFREVPRALTDQEIQGVIDRFAAAAGRVAAAGYDGVQVHAAHGYLLSSFLSRHTNVRRDRWGGSLENRFRIVGETLKAVRETVGRTFPVLIKLNSFEKARDGIKPAECLEFARLVEKTGCADAVEISAGGSGEEAFTMARGKFPTDAILTYFRPYCKKGKVVKFLIRYLAGPILSLFQPPFQEGYNLETAAMVKKAISLPVITVGGMRTKAFMEAAVREGKTDFVSMARPLLLEPDLANKFRSGESDAAQCDNCNICLMAADAVPIRCHKDEFAEPLE